MAKKQTNSLLSLPNIGKVTARKLEAIGIVTREQFLSLDPYEVFLRLKTEVDPTLCRCALACIIGAHAGIKWPQIRAEAAKEWELRFPDAPTWNCYC
jgi:DNA transformation protein